MTADSEARVRRRPSWCWRWLTTLAAAQIGAGLGALLPGYVYAAFNRFVWTAMGAPPLFQSSPISPSDSIVGAFLGFVMTWTASLVVLAIYIVIREPKPHW